MNKLYTPNFVHLHVHSHYSLLDGLSSPMELAVQAKKLGMSALALTDHGNMFGAIEFYTACREVGIKPIIGLEAYVAPNSLLEKKAKKNEIRSYHLTLLAKNEQGYKNLMQLATIGFLEGFYYKPRIDLEVLEKYKEGVICLSGCMYGAIPRRVLNGKMQEVAQVGARLKKTFGADFYLEMQDHGILEQQILRNIIPNISEDLKASIVVTNDVHYLEEEDQPVHDALLCIGTGTNVKDPNRMRFVSSELYMKSPAKMWELWPGEWLEESKKIADKCNVEIELNRTMHIYEPKSAFKTLKETCDEKFTKMVQGEGQKISEVDLASYKNRYLHEMDAIERTGYAEYLMVVADFVQFAKNNDIPVGSGRGSSSGSLVCYMLGITDIDPIHYGLLFERFINIDRVAPPDIDVDICQARRGEVIQYIKEKYGQDRVAQLTTFGSMKTRAVIKDVCRVLQFPFGIADAINKELGDHWEGSVLEAINRQDIYELLSNNMSTIDITALLHTAMKIEGRLRHSSTHAAGIVISDKPLLEVTPLYKRAGTDDILTQYDMASVEKLGLLKFDILGLRTLTVIHDACKLAGVHPDDIPLNDSTVYTSISNGKTRGVFQYEGWGYTKFIKKMRPKNFNHLIALGALYRPGPLNSGMADIYIDKMHSNDPGTDPITQETYGIMLYQEQTMQMVVRDADFTLNEADILRKAIGKKDQELMNKILPKILDPVLRSNVATFSRYGWNKAHSVAYALLSYRTAWLRFNHPVEFWCATLNSEISNSKKFPFLVQEARTDGVEILPPDINKSDVYFSVHDERLYAGLLSIKKIGQKACDRILEERKNGEFAGPADLRSRIPSRIFNKIAYEALIDADVFKERGTDAVEQQCTGSLKEALFGKE